MQSNENTVTQQAASDANHKWRRETVKVVRAVLVSTLT